jgi:hypothetical protein
MQDKAFFTIRASRMGSHANNFAGLARNLIHHPGKLDGVRIRQVIFKELY